jgi:hypothetical protein
VPPTVLTSDDQYVLGHCTRYLARDEHDPRHDFGQYAQGDPRAAISDAWRFPPVETFWDGSSAATSWPYNRVTFIFDGRASQPSSVAVAGTFGELYAPIPLAPIDFAGAPTGYFAVAVQVPKSQVHIYKYRVDGAWQLDPINPQQTVLDNGQAWSRFFTDDCPMPIELSRRERDILSRLITPLLPFRLPENQVFIRTVFDSLDQASRGQQFPLAYLLDEDVGAVNYIDKVIAREERHNAYAYHTCLNIVDGILRARNGGADPLNVPLDQYTNLYGEMATDHVDGWDYGRYHSPQFFLLMLRRHTMTGAFAHPKYGGNSGAAGWKYLEDRYTDPTSGGTLFDWQRAIEAPLGESTDYRG